MIEFFYIFLHPYLTFSHIYRIMVYFGNSRRLYPIEKGTADAVPLFTNMIFRNLPVHFLPSKYGLIVLSTACSIINMIAVSIGSMTALEMILPGRIAMKAFP